MALHDRDTALTTLAKVHDYLGIADTVTDRDAFFGIFIPLASGRISTYCCRKFAQATHTEYLNGDGTVRLWLPHWPLTTPMSGVENAGIWVDGDRTFPASSKLSEDVLDGTGTRDYIFDRQGEEHGHGLVVRLNGVWPRGVANIKAVWQGGYSSIPQEIEDAAHEYIAYLNDLHHKGLFAATSEAFAGPGGSITIPEHADIPPHLKLRLDPWRQMRLY